jgi:hypothetical protein
LIFGGAIKEALTSLQAFWHSENLEQCNDLIQFPDADLVFGILALSNLHPSSHLFLDIFGTAFLFQAFFTV